MKKLDLLLIKAIIGPFVMTFFIAMLVLIMQFLWKYIDDLVGKGLEMSVIIELICYLSASVVPLALPIAVLLTSIMVFGNLGEHYELVAFKSAGISLLRIMRPVFLVALLLSVAALYFSNYILPQANLKFSTLLFSVTKKRPAVNIKPGVFYDGIPGYVIRVGSKDDGGLVIRDVIIHNHTENRGNVNILTAERGEMYTTADNKYMVLRLFNGMQYEEPKPSSDKRSNNELMRTQFEQYELFMDLTNLDFKEANEDMFKNTHRVMPIEKLLYTADSLQAINEQRASGRQHDLRNYFNFMPDSLNKRQLQPNLPFYTANDSATEFINTLPIATSRKQAIAERGKSISQNARFVVQNSEKEIIANTKRIVRFLIEVHSKISLSVACLVLFLVGAPLGAIIRRGGLGMPMVVAIAFFILYHLISTLGKKFAEELVLTPFQGMWLSTFVLLPLGLFLTYKATHDSALLNADAYAHFFKRIFKRKA